MRTPAHATRTVSFSPVDSPVENPGTARSGYQSTPLHNSTARSLCRVSVVHIPPIQTMRRRGETQRPATNGPPQSGVEALAALERIIHIRKEIASRRRREESRIFTDQPPQPPAPLTDWLSWGRMPSSLLRRYACIRFDNDFLHFLIALPPAPGLPLGRPRAKLEDVTSLLSAKTP